MSVELTEEIKNSVVFQRYERAVLKKRSAVIASRITSAKDKVAYAKLGNGFDKKQRKQFLESDEGKLLVEKQLESDPKYTSIIGFAESLTVGEIAFFIKNREYILQMQDKGYTEYSETAIKNYIKKLEEEAAKNLAQQLQLKLLEAVGYKKLKEFVKVAQKEIDCVSVIKEALSKEKVYIYYTVVTPWDDEYAHKMGLSGTNYEDCFEKVNDHKRQESLREFCHLVISKQLNKIVTDRIKRVFKELKYKVSESKPFFNVYKSTLLNLCQNDQSYFESLDLTDFSLEVLEESLRKNPHYSEIWEAVDARREKDRIWKEALLDYIPENYIDLYPLARKLHRKFVLHIGPTNSGKTYSAIERMLQGENGIYLGPLRLLAFEQFEKINNRGVKCNLLTGEEESIVDGAKFQASTIEMLDLGKHYDIVVIDEAQLLMDEFRGGAWTTAILGICANEIHVCAAGYAENILKRLIEECGDEYEIVKHDRLAELREDRAPFGFPKSVYSGDALIVFSRKAVHSVAADLQKKGIKCSVIYGALPYDVRHEEARKFTTGETSVLVATDAIGMGLNLPIKRVVLLEQTKFDGKEMRKLTSAEIQQIIGRAGRAGIYNIGEYGILADNGMPVKQFRKLVVENIPEIKEARLAFPEALIGIDSKLSEILKHWDALSTKKGFIKSSVKREIKLAEMLEDETENKQLIYNFITIPFDETKDALKYRWYEYARKYIKDGNISFSCREYKGDIKSSEELQDAEEVYSALDLEYQLCHRFGKPEMVQWILDAKIELSKKIMQFLATQKLKGRKCNICGKALSWNYPYGRCGKCHAKIISRYYGDYDDWY